MKTYFKLYYFIYNFKLIYIPFATKLYRDYSFVSFYLISQKYKKNYIDSMSHNF